ncbi:MAG: putative Holliday junction resolvase [Hyphomicrobiaceae bacterium]|jgi:putative Holliday junction resolvase
MTNERLAGLDIGDKRIGVAVSDGLALTAQGLGVVTRQSNAKDIAAILAMLQDYNIAGFIAGLPIEMSGHEGSQADKVRHFCGHLERGTNLPIQFQDERLTSVASERMLIEAGVRRGKRRKVIDQVAAVLILQAWLDTGGGPTLP